MTAQVLFDATFLFLLFDPSAKISHHPDTGKPVDFAKERVDGLIKSFEKDRVKIGVPTPALSELLVGAGSNLNDYMNTISASSSFKILPFEEKAAIECAIIGGKELKKKEIDSTVTKAKLKFDRQILAIALAENIKTVYTDDDHLAKLCVKHGLTVIKIHEVPVPEEVRQGNLDV